jgi:hypothetical protein
MLPKILPSTAANSKHAKNINISPSTALKRKVIGLYLAMLSPSLFLL